MKVFSNLPFRPVTSDQSPVTGLNLTVLTDCYQIGIFNRFIYQILLTEFLYGESVLVGCPIKRIYFLQDASSITLEVSLYT